MTLAIHGGKPHRTKPFPAYNTIGAEEKEAVAKVLDTGVLSKFLGCRHDDFNGGTQIRALEEEWATHFGVKHAITVNSCTSGLYCAVGAVGIEPGDEVIVSPYTMCASATAPLIFNALPVFADIEQDYFCLDPRSVEQRISSKTKAIIVVDIFGLPYDADAINAIAKRHNLYVIEDTAQAPGAKYKDKFAGALADIGVYSLNYHKHIHCGEGGVVVTDDDTLAERVRLIRNHAEAVIEADGKIDLTNMIGFNFRMTEIEAAIARCQLRKLSELHEKRQENTRYLEDRLATLPPLQLPEVRKDCSHAYYIHALRFRDAQITRNAYIDAVKAELPHFELRETEGVKLGCGYVKPLYMQPMFQKQIAYGSRGCPFGPPWTDRAVDYSAGICPVTERMHFHELITHEFMLPSMTRRDIDDVVAAFEKVWEQRAQLFQSPIGSAA